jgi:membrane-bound metal-dependent hydrolase YbcI (DUF457 family)
MAMFREHVAAGAIVSVAAVTGVFFYSLLVDPLLLAILFGVIVVGSFLPDVDSDSGLPFYLVYGTASVIGTGYMALYVLAHLAGSEWYWLLGIPAAALFFFWFILGGIIKKFTVHRGIFHSIPATLIAGLGILLAARYLDLPENVCMLMGAGMALGYLTHLVLDELHSAVDFEGIPFVPKQSLGTALKVFSNSSYVNMATYVVLTSLLYLTLV